MLSFWLLAFFGVAIIAYGVYRTVTVFRRRTRTGQRSEEDKDWGTCEHCSQTFRYQLVHNGFNDSAYAYCDRCGYTVTVDAWSQHPPRLGLQYHRPLPREAEPFLRPCPCGGAFREGAHPRCPNCKQPLSADLATSYIEANARGTAKGWRWDRRWNGVYSIIVEERSVINWWKPEETQAASTGHQATTL
jgi:hypothetical protein